ncbi:Cytochrome P450 704C1 [Dendrobium catenatum]|uniref:noroxomaritidine synthase n=1 Tax=Dendrobium catenatum TaxID=906689 RepID=A0A2I0X5G1_9ASPA|nr:Cytochrome P450 704C1 [Dendrobium catenatum]
MELVADAKLLAMAVGVACFLVAVCLLKPIVNLLFRKKNYPPVAGTIFHQLLNLHRLPDFQTDLSRRYKTFRILAPFFNYVYTVDPINIEYILKTNFANFGKGHIVNDIMKDLLGNGIFTVDGDMWRHQRKVSSLEFSTKVLRDYSSHVFRSNAIKLSVLISEAANSSKIIDIQNLFMRSTMDSIFKVGFGVELDTLGGSNKEGSIFAKAFDDSSSQTLRRFFDVFWKISRALNIGLEAQLRKNRKLIDEFVYKVINEKIEQLSQKKDDALLKEDILSRLLMERERDPETISYQYLRDIVLNFLLAGRDTTADDTLPDGFDLKEGDLVNYQPFPMGRMKFLWGDDAEVFRPDRWLNNDGLFVAESPFKFPAFQAGPRICLGKDFAYRQMKIFAATLLYYFKFEISADQIVNYRSMLTLQIDGELHLRALCR